MGCNCCMRGHASARRALSGGHASHLRIGPALRQVRCVVRPLAGPDGRYFERLGKVRARGESGGLTRKEAERAIRRLMELESVRQSMQRIHVSPAIGRRRVESVATILALFAHHALHIEPATDAMAGATVMLYTSRAPLERSLASIECRGYRAAPRVCGGRS